MYRKIICRLFLLAVTFAANAYGDGPANPELPEKLTQAGIVVQSEHIVGLPDFYRDRDSGETYITLTPEQLGGEFICAAKFLDGMADIWTSRGLHSEAVIITLLRNNSGTEH